MRKDMNVSVITNFSTAVGAGQNAVYEQLQAEYGVNIQDIASDASAMVMPTQNLPQPEIDIHSQPDLAPHSKLKLVTQDGEFTDGFDPLDYFFDKDIDPSVLGNYLDTDFEYVQIAKTKRMLNQILPFFHNIFVAANVNFEALKQYPSLAELSLEYINGFYSRLLYFQNIVDRHNVRAKTTHHANLPYFALTPHENVELSTVCGSLRLTYEKARGVYFDPKGPQSKSNFMGVKSQYILDILGRYKVGLGRNEFILWANIIKQSCEVNPKKQIVPDFILASRMGEYGFSAGRNDEVFQQKLFDYKKILEERAKSNTAFAIMERLFQIDKVDVTRYMTIKVTERDPHSVHQNKGRDISRHNMHASATDLRDFEEQKARKLSNAHFEGYDDKKRRRSRPLSNPDQFAFAKSLYDQISYKWIPHHHSCYDRFLARQVTQAYPSADVSVRIRQEFLALLPKNGPV